MSVSVEFFFDLSSPWTRLAFHNLPAALEGLDTEITLRPFLVGGVFNAVNQDIYKMREEGSAKLAWAFVWMKEWAALADVPMNFPSEHHPVKSVHAMRLCCALEDDQLALRQFAAAAFHAYFAEQRNLDDPQVLAAIADECGMDGAALVAQTQEQSVKDRLRANTEEAIERGAFGSPTIFVARDYLYFGNDQMPLVRARAVAELRG